MTRTLARPPGPRSRAAAPQPATAPAVARQRPVARRQNLEPGQDVVERLLEAARRAADLTGLDRIVSVVDDDAHAQCQGRFEAPARDNEALRQTLGTTSPWTSA